MELQTLIVVLIVGAAALYMGRRLLRAIRGTRIVEGEAGCGSGGCGCEPGPANGRPVEMKKGASRIG